MLGDTACYGGQHVQVSDIDHAMTCPKLSGNRSRRHDDWKDALSRVTAHAAYSNRVEPGYEVGTAAPGRACSGFGLPVHAQLLRLFVTQIRAGNHQRHTRTRNVSLPMQANHTVRGARKQPPNWDATHAASEDTTHTSCVPLLCTPVDCNGKLSLIHI